ncbi:GntR family transcriptional regulator [Georgenia sp. Z1344]|uniref:GntR family transcriptional regulator n=1 Tax=Georgenia sp. Z1344 TaxID=3416706 RepID=UPI003CE7B007
MFDGPEPIYQQIAEHLRRQIVTGNLREEEQVMSTTQFSTTYRINPATAAKAFALLVDEGILYKQRGVGMFVAPGAPAALLASGREAFFAEHLDPVLAEAAALGITEGEIIAHIKGATS